MIDYQSARACDKTLSITKKRCRALYGPRCKVMGVSDIYLKVSQFLSVSLIKLNCKMAFNGLV